MRISGGAARGIPLQVPPGADVRPSTDSLRQAVFSSLAARIPGTRFLDLFAGSGAFGLEALSRGAAGGAFVERNAKAAGCLRRNLAAVAKSLGRSADDIAVVQADVFSTRAEEIGPADLIFADPPFPDLPALAPVLFARLGVLCQGQPDPLIVLKLPGGTDLPSSGWKRIKQLGSDPLAAFYVRG